MSGVIKPVNNWGPRLAPKGLTPPYPAPKSQFLCQRPKFASVDLDPAAQGTISHSASSEIFDDAYRAYGNVRARMIQSRSTQSQYTCLVRSHHSALDNGPANNCGIGDLTAF